MKRTLVISVVVLVLAIAGGGFWLYNRLLGDAPAASGPIGVAPVASQPGALVFQIVPDKSEVRFTIPEDLRGQPNSVVGKSNQVAGQIAVNPDDLSAAQVGVIQVNARTFVTDDGRRNRAINNFILNTAEYEFITLTPTEIRGLSGRAELGRDLTFQIVGDLTIRDVTKPVVFDVIARPTSEMQMTGSASTTINRGDFQLQIPNVPFVANVGEQIALAIDFVAEATQQ
jgi:polyisoprenoid-binding protein YceI